MKVLEIPVIGSSKTEKEKLYTLLSEEPVRNFRGLDFGSVQLSKDFVIYLYFLNQENENYDFLWDLIIPHSIGCLVVCDLESEEIAVANISVIDQLLGKFSTPLHICTLKRHKDLPDILKERGFDIENNLELLYFDPSDKNSAKDILLNIINIK